MARIAAGGFHHETNSFAPVKASLKDFVQADGWPPLSEGKAMLHEVAGINIPIAGFLDELQERHQIVPLLWCSAQPSNVVEDAAYEDIIGRLLFRLKAALPLDAVYLDLHGAMITESHLDADGETLRRVREVIGPDTPLIVSLDMHANVSRDMFDIADWIVGFRTYPHIDMADTGKRAGLALERYISMGRKPIKMYRKIPYLIPITSQCTLIEPMHGIMKIASAYVQQGDAVEIFTGFPPGDTPDTGPTLYGCGFDEVDVSTGLNELYEHFLSIERAFHSDLLSPLAAVERAKRLYRNRPVIIADTQDNPGAGGSSDTVGMLEALVQAEAQGAVFACLHDPENAKKAHTLGEGKEADFALGAHSGMPGHTPFKGKFVVEKLGDGQITAIGSMYKGSRMQLGPMACLKMGGIRVVLTSIKQQCADRSILYHMGIKPEQERILVLKSSVHFRADFQGIAKEILLAASPGPNIEDPEKLSYKHLRNGVRLRPEGLPFVRSKGRVMA